MAPRTLFAAERRMLERQGRPLPDAAAAPVSGGMDEKKLLAAIDELKEEIRKSLLPRTAESMPEFSVLQGQLYELRASIDRTKQEIAAVRRPGQEDDRLTNAGLELNAIVESTEDATNDILNATEEIDERIHKIREASPAPESLALLDEVNGLTIKILEACNFQDLSGQRINKVVKIINYLEDRITTMIDIWGAEEFANIEVAKEEKSADEALLEGPQMAGEGVSQNDIDSLFD